MMRNPVSTVVPGFLKMYPSLLTLCTTLQLSLFKACSILSRIVHSKAVYNPLFITGYSTVHGTQYPQA